MTVRVVGSGLGRTGTMSLKLALERLLGGTCYHMAEAFRRPADFDVWHRAAMGETPDWREFFRDFTAVVDWPAAPFWRSISAAFPDAIILHSTRSDAATWHRSAAATIFRPPTDPDSPLERAWLKIAALTFDGSYLDRDVAIAGYERHNADVISTAPSDRLVRYRPGDGWAPICAALDMPVPDEPFPHVNTTQEFQSRYDA